MLPNINSSPLVSVVIPTYNRANLIGETIQSVIDQTYSNWELIIIDDGSIDDSANVVKSFHDKRISYYPIPHSGILGKVRNVGMRFSKGQLIAFLDSDDLWRADKLEFQINLLQQYPHAALILSLGEQFGKGSIPPPKVERLFIGHVLLPILEERLVFYVPSVMFKKSVIEQIGFIDENIVSACDLDFVLRIAKQFEAIFTNELLVKIRKHNHSHAKESMFIVSLEYQNMIKKFFLEGSLTRKKYIGLSSKQYYKFGLLCLRKAKPVQAAKIFLKHNIIKPVNYKGWLRLLQSMYCIIRLNRQ